MKIAISYQTALERYPKQVKEIMDKLSKGKSKEKNAKPEELQWCFDWCVQITRGVINGTDIFKVLSGEIKKEPEPEGIEAKVEDYAKRCGVIIMASKGRWYGMSSRIDVPPEILDSYRKGVEEEEKEKARIDSLTPEQRDAEVQECLKKLRRSSGFMEIHL